VITTPSWKILGDSCTGTSHLQRNTACQDFWKHAVYGENQEWLAIAVADGAGSAKYGEVGAEYACNQMMGALEILSSEKQTDRDEIFKIIADIHAKLKIEAERMQTTPRELACTLLIAVLGPNRAAFFQIGDGFIIIPADNAYRTVFWPEETEYANATFFLTENNYEKSVQFVEMDSTVNEIAIMTDGLQRLAVNFEHKIPYDKFILPIFEAMNANLSSEALQEEFRKFLNSDRVNARTDDDKTLVLAKRIH
jgi:hypothetical protein